MSSPRRKLLLCSLAVLAVGIAAAPAQARITWVIRGHGFGHGVGMSQYGAYGYAKHGKGYRFILRHYYPGTSPAKASGPRVVRVLLDISPSDVTFGNARSACGARLDPRREYRAHRVGSRVQLRGTRGRLIAACGSKLRAAGGGSVRIDGVGAYRGALEVVATHSDAGSLNVINALSVNQYVKGVIPNEVPSSWPMAALRAQAVAARSYALSVQVDGNGFNLYDDTGSQVYRGLASETARASRAALDTWGEVLEYRGEIAQTYFFACSGGRTESVQNVFFGEPLPYLRSVGDPYDYYCPLHSWKLRLSEPQIEAKLGRYLRGRLRRVAVTRRGGSPRIVWARLYGSRGTTMIRGDRLQAALGAYDRWMTFRKVGGGKPRGSRAGGAPSGGGGGGLPR